MGEREKIPRENSKFLSPWKKKSIRREQHCCSSVFSGRTRLDASKTTRGREERQTHLPDRQTFTCMHYILMIKSENKEDSISRSSAKVWHLEVFSLCLSLSLSPFLFLLMQAERRREFCRLIACPCSSSSHSIEWVFERETYPLVKYLLTRLKSARHHFSSSSSSSVKGLTINRLCDDWINSNRELQLNWTRHASLFSSNNLWSCRLFVFLDIVRYDMSTTNVDFSLPTQINEQKKRPDTHKSSGWFLLRLRLVNGTKFIQADFLRHWI